MQNKKPDVTILWDEDKKKLKVKPPILKVKHGDKVEFFSPVSNAKISFPDSEIIDIDGWETIAEGSSIEGIVKSSAVKGKKYYYAVLCKHNDGKYTYAEGNSCPAMKVDG